MDLRSVVLAAGVCSLIALPTCHTQLCTLGVDDPAEGSCIQYDLSSLQDDDGYVVGDQDSPGKLEYILNVCGNVDKGRAPPACSQLPDSPIFQISRDANACFYLGQLDSQLTYPVDPNNPRAGVRVVYYNGENVTEPDLHSDRIDYGNLGIGDEENGFFKPKPSGDYQGGTVVSRSAIIDFVCDPEAGHGTPEPVYMWPEFVYRVKWRSAKACPVSSVAKACPARPYQPTWAGVSFRPTPTWFDDVKFGIFLHWGVFSVPGYKSAWYWRYLMTAQAEYVKFHNRVYGCSGVEPDKYPCTGEKFTYQQFTSMWHAELYNPDEWAQLFKDAGAKYVVLTSKHHEGFCNFPSAEHWNWNSMDVGPHMDLVGKLTDSVRAAGLHMGLYHSLREWYNPLFLQDNENNCKDPRFVKEVLIPTLKNLTMRYKPEIIWADGSGGDNYCSHDSRRYWQAPEFLTWLYNESPVKDTVLVNSRWGVNSGGDYSTGPDRWSPGKRVASKWESCFTVQRTSWVYDKTEGIEGFYNTEDLVYKLIETVSCNGNLLLNVGPTADGRIVPAFQERLLQMGAWLKVNGEAIYGTKPWIAQNDTASQRLWYTQSKKSGTVYAMSYDWPARTGTTRDDIILTQVKDASPNVTATLLGMEGTLTTRQMPDGLHIAVPNMDQDDLPTQYAWTFAITGLEQTTTKP